VVKQAMDLDEFLNSQEVAEWVGITRRILVRLLDKAPSCPTKNDTKHPSLISAKQLAYSQKQAAKMLGIGRCSLWKETSLGRITKTALGLYSLAELERYLAAETEKARQKAKKQTSK